MQPAWAGQYGAGQLSAFIQRIGEIDVLVENLRKVRGFFRMKASQ